MRKSNKIIALILSVVMLVSVMPIDLFADEVLPDNGEAIQTTIDGAEAESSVDNSGLITEDSVNNAENGDGQTESEGEKTAETVTSSEINSETASVTADGETETTSDLPADSASSGDEQQNVSEGEKTGDAAANEQSSDANNGEKNSDSESVSTDSASSGDEQQSVSEGEKNDDTAANEQSSDENKGESETGSESVPADAAKSGDEQQSVSDGEENSEKNSGDAESSQTETGNENQQETPSDSENGGEKTEVEIKETQSLAAAGEPTRDSSDWSAIAEFIGDAGATSAQWSASGSTANAIAAKAFFMQIISSNTTGTDQNKDFVLTGSNLDTVVFPAFVVDGEEQLNTPVKILTDSHGIDYYATMNRTSDSITINFKAGSMPDGQSAVTPALLQVNFKPHSNGGSISINSADAPSGAVTTVNETVKNPTLNTTNSTSTDFYQWLADKSDNGYVNMTLTSTPTTNSSSDYAIPYLEGATVTQTVTFNRFALTAEPTITGIPSGAVIAYQRNSDNNIIGYTVTYEKTADGSAEISLPAIKSTLRIERNKMVPSSTGLSTNQGISVNSTITGTPVNSDTPLDTVTGTVATRQALVYADVDWTIDGVDGSNPRTNKTKTNSDVANGSNVTQYNISTTFTSVGNSAVFVYQGEGPTRSSTTAQVHSSYYDAFDHEITSLRITNKTTGEVVVADLADAYARGMIDQVDGKYVLKRSGSGTTTQSYMPILPLHDTEGNNSWISGEFDLDIGIKTTVKLDENNRASIPSGTNTSVRFFVAPGTTASDYQLPAATDPSPRNGAAGIVDSLYVDLVNTEAEFEISKTGRFDKDTSQITYNVTLNNSSREAHSGEFTDFWPPRVQLKTISGVANTIITLSFEDGTTQTITQTAGTYTYTGTKAVTMIRVQGFTVPAATYSSETSETPTAKGAKSFTLIGSAKDNTPFTVTNRAGTPHGTDGTMTYARRRMVIADCITKNVFSDEACTDPIEGVETVDKEQYVYFKVVVKNTSTNDAGEPQTLPFKLFDSSEPGMTLISATYNGTNIPFDNPDDDTDDGIKTFAPEPNDPSAVSLSNRNYQYPVVSIEGAHSGVWVMKYQIDENTTATELLNTAYVEVYLDDDDEPYAAFRSQTAEASVTLGANRSADISIDKRVSNYVYHDGSLTTAVISQNNPNFIHAA